MGSLVAGSSSPLPDPFEPFPREEAGRAGVLPGKMKAPGGAGVTGGNGIFGIPRGVVGCVFIGKGSNISEDASSRG